MGIRVVVATALCAAACLARPAPGRIAANTTVAVVGGQRITYADIRKEVGWRLDQMAAKHAIERRNLEADTLRSLIEKRLLAAEAKRRGITVATLLDTEVNRKVADPTDAEIQKVYERAKSQIDVPLEVLKPRIVGFLRSRKGSELRARLIEGLRGSFAVREELPAPDLPKIEVPEAGNPARGPVDAPIKMVIFSDFECPFCARVVPTLHELMKKYDRKIRMVFRDFPLEMHPNARRAAEAAQCVNEQGKFWEYHDRLFAQQDKLGERDLIEHGKAIRVDVAALEKCLKSGKYKAEVERDLRDGEKLGVTGTPAVFVNGVMLSGAQPIAKFTEIIDLFLRQAGK